MCVYIRAYVNILKQNHWTYRHQTWQVDMYMTTPAMVTYFVWGQKVKCQGRCEFAVFWVPVL